MEVVRSVEADRLQMLLAAGRFFWLDLEDPSEEEIDRVGELLGLTELARKDTKNFEQRAKVDDFGDHLLLVLFSAVPVPSDPEREWRPLEVHVYVSGDWILTVRKRECMPLHEACETLSHEEGISEVRMVWRVLRAIIDAFEPALESLERRIDLQEKQVFEQVRRARLSDLYHLRQETTDLLRRAASQRDIWPYAAERLCALPGLEQDSQPLLDDVGDQFVEVGGELERHAADAASLIDVYFSASGDRLSRLATRLTVLATFFLSWTLVTGFFGQNFEWLIGTVDSEADFWLWGVGGLVAATLAAWAIVWLYRRSE